MRETVRRQLDDSAHPLGTEGNRYSALDEPTRAARLQERIVKQGQQPFNLAKDSLLRVSLARLSAQEQVLILTEHHLVHDGWTQGVLLRDFLAIYQAFMEGKPSPLPELPVQYADYAYWQRQWLQGEILQRQIDYWQEQLAGAPSVLDLP